jgi:hypothetical protein
MLNSKIIYTLQLRNIQVFRLNLYVRGNTRLYRLYQVLHVPDDCVKNYHLVDGLKVLRHQSVLRHPCQNCSDGHHRFLDVYLSRRQNPIR